MPDVSLKFKSDFPGFSKANARKLVAERDDDLTLGQFRYVFDVDLLQSDSVYVMIRGENLDVPSDMILKRTGDTNAPESEFIPIPGGVNSLSANAAGSSTADFQISFWGAQKLALTVTPQGGLTQGTIKKIILIGKDW